MNLKVFIDAGHGGTDPGAVGSLGTYESSVTLGVAKALSKALSRCKAEVKLSREGDVTLSLGDRADMANKWNADFFVSIHCNGFIGSNAHGTEVYSYLGDETGNAAAKEILQNVCSAIGTVSRGAKQENFAVLRLSKMPAVLIETAFITNPGEEAKMLESGFCEKVAEAVAKAICKCFSLTYTQESTSVHWGEEYLASLMSKGIIKNPELWRSFDAPPTTAMVLALADKLSEVRK